MPSGRSSASVSNCPRSQEKRRNPAPAACTELEQLEPSRQLGAHLRGQRDHEDDVAQAGLVSLLKGKHDDHRRGEAEREGELPGHAERLTA